jgi:hypothetical protein
VGTWGLAWLLLLGPIGSVWGQERTPNSDLDEAIGFRELTPETRRAIRRGVAWLAREQLDSSGSWPSNPPRYKMSVSALAGLALLANGNTPDSGPYAANLRKLVKWLISSQDQYAARNPKLAGLLFDRLEGARDDRPMHGHGFALLFLSECYGNTRDPVLRQRMRLAMKKAIHVTEVSISRDGGWYYHPVPRAGDQYRDEGSVTITQIQALRSAHNAGIDVDPSIISRAVEYVRQSQDKKTGGVRYTRQYGKTSAALTAAGVSVFHGAGEYHSEALKLGYGYLRLTSDPAKQQSFFYYTHLYVVQAMFQQGGPEWATYFPKIRRELLARLKGDKPYWAHRYGNAYATSISLLILQVPMRYLPIFQR